MEERCGRSELRINKSNRGHKQNTTSKFQGMREGPRDFKSTTKKTMNICFSRVKTRCGNKNICRITPKEYENIKRNRKL